MKTLLVTFFFVATIQITGINKPEAEQACLVESIKTEYCEGWDDGYEAGYCYNRGIGCIAPIPPICPVPKVGETEYKHGYNRGFVKGRR